MAYKNKAGRTLFCPVAESDGELFAVTESEEGFCLGCGSTRSCVEPDARRYPCEVCGEHLVYGFQELLLMGLLKCGEESG